MNEITEGTLHFRFEPGWRSIKYDDTRFHRERFGHYRAFDILSTREDRHFWIEIKDCLGAEKDNLPRLSKSNVEEVDKTRSWVKAQGWQKAVSVDRRKPYIIDELISKLRDTLVGVTVAAHQSDQELSGYLPEAKDNWRIVLLITWDDKEFRRMARLLNQKFNQSLRPYGLTGYVLNESTCEHVIPCIVSRAD